MVLVPGFTQTASSWRGVVEIVEQTCEVVALDVPVRETFGQTASALGTRGRAGVYVGYSMGGRLCLRTALDRPDVVTALVLVGASPGIADEGERAARRASDEALAAEIERVGTAAFLEQWLARPMFSTFTPAPADMDARLANTSRGLATALRRLGPGAQEPLWDRLGELEMPVLVVAGQDDAKFTHIAEEMADAIGVNAQVVALAGAGHAAHLERPGSFCRLLAAFLVLHPATS